MIKKQSKLNISDLMGGSIILKTISVPFFNSESKRNNIKRNVHVTDIDTKLIGYRLVGQFTLYKPP